MSNQSSTQVSATPPAAGKDSDLAQAAAGLLSVRKSAPSNLLSAASNPPTSFANTNALDSSTSSCCNNLDFAGTDVHTTPAASRAAGLRSLQAVESIIKTHQVKSVPPNPLEGIDGSKVTPEEQQAWKRARSCVYTQRNRAKKSEQIELLEQGITFFKQQLGIHVPQIDKREDTKKPSKLKGVKRNVYLPPEEKRKHMSEKEISEWKRNERLKRKREANAASTKQQQEHLLQLAVEHERLHEQYKAKCRKSGNVEQEWNEQSMMG